MSILATLSSAPADAAAAALFAAPAVQYASGTGSSKRSADGSKRKMPSAMVPSSTSAVVESDSGSSPAPKKRSKASNPQAGAADKAAAVEAAAKAAALLGIKSDPGAVKKENLRARSMSSAAPQGTEGESRPAVHRRARLSSLKSKESGKRAEASTSADAEDSCVSVAPAAAEDARLMRTIFVGNIPPATRRHALTKHFASFGAVESVRIRSVASSNLKLARRAAVIKQAIDTSVRDAVNAYVVFADEAAVVKALAANGQVAFGRHLRVDRAVASKRQADGDEGSPPMADGGAAFAVAHKRSVFLGNLAFDLQEEAVWEAFGPFGTVEYVRLVRDPQTQHGKGFGYVCFTERASVESALSLHETKLNGRTLRVFRCKGEASARGGAKGSKGGAKAEAKPGVDWKNRPAASLRLQLAASAKARKKAKGGGGIAKKAKGSAVKKAGGNRKLPKGASAVKPAPTPSQLAHIKAGKNKAKAAAKRSLAGKGRAGANG